MLSNDNADDFVLGALRARHRDLIARERLYHKDLDSRICNFEDLLSALTPVGVCAAPPPDVWQQICDVLAQQPCGGGAASCAEGSIAEGSFAKGSFDCVGGPWEKHGPGIECKTLWSDKALLIRCEPGASEDRHPQPEDEDEHIVVIAGGLVIGGRTLLAGDYVKIPAAASHPDMHTLSGCLIFTQYELVSQC